MIVKAILRIDSIKMHQVQNIFMNLRILKGETLSDMLQQLLHLCKLYSPSDQKYAVNRLVRVLISFSEFSKFESRLHPSYVNYEQLVIDAIGQCQIYVGLSASLPKNDKPDNKPDKDVKASNSQVSYKNTTCSYCKRKGYAVKRC